MGIVIAHFPLISSGRSSRAAVVPRGGSSGPRANRSGSGAEVARCAAGIPEPDDDDAAPEPEVEETHAIPQLCWFADDAHATTQAAHGGLLDIRAAKLAAGFAERLISSFRAHCASACWSSVSSAVASANTLIFNSVIKSRPPPFARLFRIETKKLRSAKKPRVIVPPNYTFFPNYNFV